MSVPVRGGRRLVGRGLCPGTWDLREPAQGMPRCSLFSDRGHQLRPADKGCDGVPVVIRVLVSCRLRVRAFARPRPRGTCFCLSPFGVFSNPGEGGRGLAAARPGPLTPNPVRVFRAFERRPLPSVIVAVITQMICCTVTSSQRCHLKLKIHVKAGDAAFK